MRNRIAHGDFDINLDVVWDTVETALPWLPGVRQSIAPRPGLLHHRGITTSLKEARSRGDWRSTSARKSKHHAGVAERRPDPPAKAAGIASR